MKYLKIFSLLLLGSIFGGMGVWWNLSHEFWEDKRYNDYITKLRNSPNMVPSKVSDELAMRKDFWASTQQCGKDAITILKTNHVNSLQPSVVGTQDLWAGQVGVFLVTEDIDKKLYVFVCQLERNFHVKRTTIVYPRYAPIPPRALEIRQPQMLDVEF